MKTLCALTLALACYATAHADFYSGADLRRFLDASEELHAGASGATAVNAGVYAGYLAGVAESFHGIYFCPPPQSDLRAMTAIVRAYLRAHPEKQDQSAHALITRALADAYPCLSSAVAP